MSILVTGGAGFVGSNLTKKLLEKGYKVTVWDNLSTGKEENIPSEAVFQYTDISYHIASGQFDAIFHLAAKARIQPSFNHPKLNHETNVSGTVNILEHARKYNIPVIYAGSSSVYFDHYANPYSFSKWLGEEYCQLYSRVYGLNTAIARFFNVYGPNQLEEGDYSTVIGIFEKQKREGKPLTITGTGEKRRDFTNVFDICAGLIAIMEAKTQWQGEIFNFGCGRNYSINEVAAMFEPKEIAYLPNRPGEADITLADISHSQEILGYTPKIQLEDYIKEVISG
jgi:UDP-glucose 4-epimerase